MKRIRIFVSLPATMKRKLAAERERGVTTSGLIRHLLEQYFKGGKRAA
jgi:hypothetical protein